MTWTNTMVVSASIALLFTASAPVARQTCADSPARSGYAMTYDSKRAMVLVFGGEAPSGDLSAALLGWNGRAWTCVAPDGPPPRSDATLMYDETRHTLVLYGGRAGRDIFRDTWEFDRTWKRIDGDGPSLEPHGVGAYDRTSGAVLLFNGTGDDSPARRTWKLEGGKWHVVSDQPAGEFPDAMFAGDTHRPARLVTARRTGVRGAFTAQLYDWRSNAWTPLAVTGTIPAFSPQAPAARTSAGALLFAGFEVDGSVATWVLEGSAWTKAAGPSPGRRKGAQMVFDPARGVVVLHSGDDGSRLIDDTWEWNGTAWRKVR